MFLFHNNRDYIGLIHHYTLAPSTEGTLGNMCCVDYKKHRTRLGESSGERT